MKRKLLTILLMCTLSVSVTACGNNNSENNTTPEVSEKDNTQESDSEKDNTQESDSEKDDAQESDSEKDDAQESNSEKDDTQESDSEKDDTQESDNTNSETESQPEENSETIYEIGNSASLKDWTITVTDAQIVDSIAANYGSFSPNEEGNKYVQVFATVNNDGKQADRFLPTIGMGNDVNVKVLYSDGYEFTATNLLGYNNDLHDSTINPLSSQTGEIAFEIPSTVADSEDELLIQFSSGNDVLKFKIR